jgi:hypothetical protein
MYAYVNGTILCDSCAEAEDMLYGYHYHSTKNDNDKCDICGESEKPTTLKQDLFNALDPDLNI